VSKLPGTSAVEDQLRLAATLTSQSEAMWRCYTHPGRATDDRESNGGGRRREQSGESCMEVLASIKTPSSSARHHAPR
jgi:hypothetical protein